MDIFSSLVTHILLSPLSHVSTLHPFYSPFPPFSPIQFPSPLLPDFSTLPFSSFPTSMLLLIPSYHFPVQAQKESKTRKQSKANNALGHFQSSVPVVMPDTLSPSLPTFSLIYIFWVNALSRLGLLCSYTANGQLYQYKKVTNLIEAFRCHWVHLYMLSMHCKLTVQ